MRQPFVTQALIGCMLTLGASGQPSRLIAANPEPGEARQRHDQETIDRVARRLLSSPLAERRLDATMEQLRGWMLVPAGPALIAAAADEASTAVRIRLIDEFAGVGTPEAFGAVALLGARHSDVRDHAADVFLSLADEKGTEEGVFVLAKELRGHAIGRVNGAAAFIERIGAVELLPQLASALVEVRITGRPRIPFAGNCDENVYPYLISTKDLERIRIHRVLMIRATGERFESTFEHSAPRNRDFVAYETLFGCDLFGGVLINSVGEPDLRFAVDEGDELVMMEGEVRVSYRPVVLEVLRKLAGSLDRRLPELGYNERAWLNWIDEAAIQEAEDSSAPPAGSSPAAR